MRFPKRSAWGGTAAPATGGHCSSTRQAPGGAGILGGGSLCPWSAQGLCRGEARLRSPASQHQLLLGWPVPNSGVNVHREQSTGTVKNGSQGAHKGGQHD